MPSSASSWRRAYAGASVEAIASRAGVAKTTIYRRWGGLDGLLAALLAQHAAQEIPVPDMGDLGADLRALARQVVASLRHPAVRAAFATIVAAAMQDTAARESLSGFIAARVAAMTVIVRHAVRRGELPPDTDAAEVILTVTALVYYRLFILGEQLSPATADRAAAITMAAALAGAIAVPQPPDKQPEAGA
jgi:AcrR family transcriptional regulator